MSVSAFCQGSMSGPRRWLGYMLDYVYTGTEAKPAVLPLSKALLARSDDSTSNAIIAAFEQDPMFAGFARSETDAILARDAEDGEKLAAGIRKAVAKGVCEAEPPVEPTTKINVAGKSADTVAAEITAKLGSAASSGCVLVLQGLSGTGKGTTVAKLQEVLPKCLSWSNGNVFRSLTLLAVTYCEVKGIPFSSEVLTPALLAELMTCLSFGKFDGKFDTHIKGYGLDLYVSKVANTTLKEPKVSKNIPTVAELTQGEVIKFAGDAAAAMQADGMNVLMEGRSQTLDYVRTPHRFELTLPDSLIIGKRRAAQRMMGAALNTLKEQAEPPPAEVHLTLQAELAKMV